MAKLLEIAPQVRLALITDGRSADYQDRMYDTLEAGWRFATTVKIPVWGRYRFDKLMIWQRR